MNIVSDLAHWREIRKNITQKTIGFIPTMGNLHAGHLSLCERSKKENDLTVVSIFVNPTQFNQSNDFKSYPRTLEQDSQLLDVDYLLLPTSKEMYPDDYQIQINETDLSLILEGEHRPGHFSGMLTVVLKLLNLIQAHRTYFGEKDFQQLLLIKKMVAALFLSTEIIACETIRAEDGLALSSRNSRLTKEQRIKAKLFPDLLRSHKSIETIIYELNVAGFEVDYITERWQRRLGAVSLGGVRLIDNVAVEG